MQPLSRLYSFIVGLLSTLVGTTLAVLLLQSPNPAPLWLMVLLAIAGPVLTWMGTQGKAILQGKESTFAEEETPKTDPPTFTGANLLPLLFLLPLLAACGLSRTDQARVAIAATERTLTTAASALVDADRTFQANIIDKATSEEEGKARLAAYRKARQPLVLAITSTQALVGPADALLALVESGVKSPSDLAPLLGRLFDAGMRVFNAVQEFIASQKVQP